MVSAFFSSDRPNVRFTQRFTRQSQYQSYRPYYPNQYSCFLIKYDVFILNYEILTKHNNNNIFSTTIPLLILQFFPHLAKAIETTFLLTTQKIPAFSTQTTVLIIAFIILTELPSSIILTTYLLGNKITHMNQ